MLLQDKVWSRRDFLKLVGRAGLVSSVPTLASAAAALNPDTVCISVLHTTDLHGHVLPTSDYDGTPDRVARRKSGVGAGKIRTRS